jgi:SprT protein
MVTGQIPEKLLPIGAREVLSQMFAPHTFILKLVKSRSTKFGDFKACSGNKKEIPQITVNNNLNPYTFLITLLHEFAHYLLWKDGHNFAKPHGRLWKAKYALLLDEMMGHHIFPETMRPLLIKHLQNPGASSSTDIKLSKELAKYDNETDFRVYIETLVDGSFFTSGKQQVFRREKKVRKLILCSLLKTNKKYLFNPLHKVIPVKNKQFMLHFPVIFIFLLKNRKKFSDEQK